MAAAVGIVLKIAAQPAAQLRAGKVPESFVGRGKCYPSGAYMLFFRACNALANRAAAAAEAGAAQFKTTMNENTKNMQVVSVLFIVC